MVQVVAIGTGVVGSPFRVSLSSQEAWLPEAAGAGSSQTMPSTQ
ncbi:hypothetical protein [Streptomyces sp. NPDC055080]